MVKFYEEGFDPDDLNIRVSELLVATADASDELIDRAVTDMLVLLKERMQMDVVFVSEFVGDKRVFRYVDGPVDQPVVQVGESELLERTWCQRVVDGRLPGVIANVSQYTDKDKLPPTAFDVGTYLSTPVLLKDGHVYGTLCCLSFSPQAIVQERDLKNLKSVAQLVAKKIDKSQTSDKSAPVTFNLVLK